VSTGPGTMPLASSFARPPRVGRHRILHACVAHTARGAVRGSAIGQIEIVPEGRREARPCVVRHYLPPGSGDSHFFSASPAECDATHAKFPQLAFETASAFHASLPEASTGACPAGTLPVYRL